MARRLSFSEFMTHRATLAAEAVVAAFVPLLYYIGEGIGKSLLCRAVDDYGVDELTVNEENARAVGFYEHMGFQPYAGTE